MGLSDLIFPTKCLGCGTNGTYLCASCAKKVGTPDEICVYCLKPAIDGATHVKCTRKLGLDGLVCMWNYRGAVKKTISALKFRYATRVASQLASKIVGKGNVSWLFTKDFILVPVPLHPIRYRNRGFNQAEVLARAIAQVTAQSVVDVVIKRKNTPTQTTLKKKDRAENIRGAFVWNSNYKLTKRLTALVVDDVYTTGSTMKEVAKVLKRRGFEKVWGLTVAR